MRIMPTLNDFIFWFLFSLLILYIILKGIGYIQSPAFIEISPFALTALLILVIRGEIRRDIFKIVKPLDSKIDEMNESLDNKIDEVNRSLDNKIDEVNRSLDNKIDKLSENITLKIDKLSERVSQQNERLGQQEGKIETILHVMGKSKS